MGLTDFLRRHRRKLFVVLGVSASVYWIMGYVSAKLRELQEKFIMDRIAQEDLERRFELNQRDANYTTLALLPTVTTQILDRYNVEAIRRELQELRASDSVASLENSNNSSLGGGSVDASTINSMGNSLEGSVGGSYVATPSKAQLWNQIKIESLTRALLLIYTMALLTVFTRVQLNILGRVAYAGNLERSAREPGSVSEAAICEDEEQAEATNRQFLTYSWWLLHRGWETLSQRVQSAVETVTADVKPNAKLSFEALSNLVGQIHLQIDRPKLEAEVAGSFLSNVLPDAELETYVLNQFPSPGGAAATGVETEITSPLREYLDETADLFESASGVRVLQQLVHAGVAVLMAKIQPMYEEETEIRLAAALMQVTKQAHQMAAGSPLSNEYLDAMVVVPELDALCASIYSNY